MKFQLVSSKPRIFPSTSSPSTGWKFSFLVLSEGKVNATCLPVERRAVSGVLWKKRKAYSLGIQKQQLAHGVSQTEEEYAYGRRYTKNGGDGRVVRSRSVDRSVRGKVREMIMALAEAELAEVLAAGSYGRSEGRRGYRNGKRQRSISTGLGATVI